MKTSNIFAACIVLLTGAVLSTPALADKASAMRATGNVPNNVTCPSNTDVSFTSNGILRCSVTLVYKREAICPPSNYPNYTLALDTGVDKCLPNGRTTDGRNDVPSAMDPLPKPPTIKGQSGGLSGDLLTAVNTIGQAALLPPDSAYERVVNPTRMDTFVAEKKVYLWPSDLPPHYTVGHSPTNGVACPAGYNDVQGRNTRGLGCEKAESRKPMCQNVLGFGWRLEVKAGRDVCHGPNSDTDDTKPDGEHGNTGAEWSLDVDGGVGNVDAWKRYTYTAPATR